MRGDIEFERRMYAHIEELKDVIAYLKSRLAVAEKALDSISKSSCCAPCQEAGLWAKQALAKIREGI